MSYLLSGRRFQSLHDLGEWLLEQFREGAALRKAWVVAPVEDAPEPPSVHTQGIGYIPGITPAQQGLGGAPAKAAQPAPGGSPRLPLWASREDRSEPRLRQPALPYLEASPRLLSGTAQCLTPFGLGRIAGAHLSNQAGCACHDLVMALQREVGAASATAGVSGRGGRLETPGRLEEGGR